MSLGYKLFTTQFLNPNLTEGSSVKDLDT